MENFDIAHYTGHKAIDELYKAFRIYIVPIEMALLEHNIQSQSMDFKEKSDINTLVRTLSIININIDDIDHINSFHIASKLTSLRKKEIECCINTAIFFQAMMEADINNLISITNLKLPKNPSFYQKWHTFLTKNKAPKHILDSFKIYFDEIYKGIRNPSIHPKDRRGLSNPELFRFPKVHENIRHGWDVFAFSISIEHNTIIDYNDNWKIMCQEIHNIPQNIIKDEFPNLEKLSGNMYKKHLDFFNNKEHNKS
ncbi:MAG: hypothetical protein KAQ94_02485 [Arcobacteraceae bacterium]|nr:hypothetical protein [Arcobacteraceae bacterium]